MWPIILPRLQELERKVPSWTSVYQVQSSFLRPFFHSSGGDSTEDCGHDCCESYSWTDQTGWQHASPNQKSMLADSRRLLLDCLAMLNIIKYFNSSQTKCQIEKNSISYSKWLKSEYLLIPSFHTFSWVGCSLGTRHAVKPGRKKQRSCLFSKIWMGRNEIFQSPSKWNLRNKK